MEGEYLAARLILHLWRDLRQLKSQRALDNAHAALAEGKRQQARQRAINALHAWPGNAAAKDFIAGLDKAD